MANICVQVSDKDTHLVFQTLPPFAMAALFEALTSTDATIGTHSIKGIPVHDSTHLAVTYEVRDEEIGDSRTRVITILAASKYESPADKTSITSRDLAAQLSTSLSQALRNMDLALLESQAIARINQGETA